VAFLIDESYLPATLTVKQMTDDQFADFCAGHPDLFFEMTAEGDLISGPPTYTLAAPEIPKSSTNCQNWARQDLRGKPPIPLPGSSFPTAPAVHPTPLGRAKPGSCNSAKGTSSGTGICVPTS
jgi:hypothetical protein